MPRRPLEYNATLIKRIDLADGLALFRVRADGDPFTTFIPGQYITLGCNHPDKGPVQRAYSIASAPQTLPDFFEFYIRYVERPASDNPLTHLLFDLHDGDRLYVGKKVVGKFTIEHEVGNDDPRLRICVAAGTGLAPFTAMLYDHMNRLGPTDRYMILHGARWPREVGYVDDLEQRLNSGPLPRRYFPTISRDPGDEPWPSHYGRGRVETFFEPDKLEQLERDAGLETGFLTPANAVVFICGLTGTIGSTILRLLDRGFVPGELKLRRALEIPDDTPPSLFFEQYDSDPVLDLHDEELMADCRRRLSAAGGSVSSHP